MKLASSSDSSSIILDYQFVSLLHFVPFDMIKMLTFSSFIASTVYFPINLDHSMKYFDIGYTCQSSVYYDAPIYLIVFNIAV